MNTIDKFNIIIGDDFLQNIDKDDVVITDDNIFGIYSDQLKVFRTIVIKSGEASKILTCVEQICRELIKFEADRKTTIVGFGGGLVCDITGFVASVYMRGVRFKLIPTSLLAQLDASVGGKNGVNLDGYKNIIGVFNNPDLVVCDPKLLNTLPKRELVSGYSEAIKCGLIASCELLDAFNKPVFDLQFIIQKSLEIKTEIVAKDPSETKGLRKFLNLGHTFGHAIEKCAPNRYLHGEAVAIGLCYAAKGSSCLGLIDKYAVAKIIDTIAKFNLPTDTDITSQKLAKAIINDKKRNHDQIDFILLKSIGEPVAYPIKADISVIEEFLVSLRSL